MIVLWSTGSVVDILVVNKAEENVVGVDVLNSPIGTITKIDNNQNISIGLTI